MDRPSQLNIKLTCESLSWNLVFQTAVNYFFHPISFIGFIVHDKQRKMSAKLDYVTTLRPEILEQAEKELGEDEHLRTESVLAIREWVKK